MPPPPPPPPFASMLRVGRRHTWRAAPGVVKAERRIAPNPWTALPPEAPHPTTGPRKRMLEEEEEAEEGRRIFTGDAKAAAARWKRDNEDDIFGLLGPPTRDRGTEKVVI